MMDSNARWFLASAKISLLKKLVDQMCHTSDALEEVKITPNCYVGCECVIDQIFANWPFTRNNFQGHEGAC